MGEINYKSPLIMTCLSWKASNNILHDQIVSSLLFLQMYAFSLKIRENYPEKTYYDFYLVIISWFASLTSVSMAIAMTVVCGKILGNYFQKLKCKSKYWSLHIEPTQVATGDESCLNKCRVQIQCCLKCQKPYYIHEETIMNKKN